MDRANDPIAGLHDRARQLVHQAPRPFADWDPLSGQAVSELQHCLEELLDASEQLQLTNLNLLTTYERLDAERRRYQDLFDSAPDGYLVTNLDGGIQVANRAAAALLQIPPGQLVDDSILQFVLEDDRAAILGQLQRLALGSGKVELEVEICPASSMPFPAALILDRIQDEASGWIGLRWLIRDISRRKRVAAEVARLNAILNSLATVTARLTHTQDLDEVLETLGAEIQTLRLQCLVALVDPPSQDLVVRYVSLGDEVMGQIARRGGLDLRTFRVPLSGLTLDERPLADAAPRFVADWRAFLTSFSPQLSDAVRDEVSRLAGLSENARLNVLPLRVGTLFLGMMAIWGEDLVEGDLERMSIFAGEMASLVQNVQLYEILEDHRSRFEDVSGQLASALEDERRRIARELHDEAGQLLYGLRLHLDALARNVPPDRPDLLHQAQQIAQLAEEARRKLRQLSHKIRPAPLDELGLASTLRQLLDDFVGEAGIALHFSATQMPVRLNAQLEMDCYRIVQEALTNVLRHAQAQTVWLSLEAQDGRLCLQVADDGRGFEPGTARLRGMGLLGIQERVKALQGTMTIASAPGLGSRLDVCLPCRPAEGSA